MAGDPTTRSLRGDGRTRHALEQQLVATSNRDRVAAAVGFLDAADVDPHALNAGERRALDELVEVRERLVGSQGFSTDDTYRALDLIERVLVALGSEAASDVGKAKDDVMR